MSGDYNLDVADQIWYQNKSIYPDRRVNLLDAPSSTGTLADALAAIATFTVGQTVSYGVNVVNPPGGVNEMWATPGVVEVSGVVSTATAVPEPSSLAVLGVGIAGLVTCRRRKRKQTA
ncbi:MAG: PEP-CTERM sorting domain-containing protein [Fuerstiella sp.]